MNLNVIQRERTEYDMYASIDFATKKAFCQAVRNGTPMVLYSPTLGTAAVNGKEFVMGPWPNRRQIPAVEPIIGPKEKRSSRGATTWTARVQVKDMMIVAVCQ